MILFKLISVFLILKCACSARILGVFPLDWGSHYILGTKLMRGLAEAGHDVTMISPRQYKNPPKNGSWTDVVLDGLGEELQGLLKEANFYDDGKKNVIEKMMSYSKMLLTISNQTLRHPKVQKLLYSNATFDAVIIEQLMNECHHIFAYQFNSPLIILSSIGPNPIVNPKVGNPAPVSTVFNFGLSEESNKMTFLTRFKNLLQHMASYLFNELYLFPRHNAILHELFPDAPDLKDLYYNVSLILLNSHSSLSNVVPLVPNMVEIGGYFINPPQKLPQDLQDFLDNAKEGAIYFSMGSNLKSKDMPEEKKRALLGCFKKLQQKIIWKFEEDLPERPENVLIKQWMPQQDILAHSKIKLFITHGGLLSTTETIYHGVPVLAIPVFGDQEMNANSAVQSGYGLKISYHDNNFNEETLYNLIQELLNNSKYREVAQTKSKIYHDRPMTALRSAVFWIEYVIRHKGAPHLRVAGIGMSWLKYFMVDVMAIFIIGVLLSVLCIKYIFKKLILTIYNKKVKSVKMKNN